MKLHVSGASREALFCIGSNCGDRALNVATALDWLSGILVDFQASNVYASPDCHGSQRVYMNSVCAGKTPLEACELEKLCKDFELGIGRDDAARSRGDVPVDIDLVIYDGKVLRERDYNSEFFRKGYFELL